MTSHSSVRLYRLVTALLIALIAAVIGASPSTAASDPSPPGGVTLSISGTDATVSWSPPSSFGTSWDGSSATLRYYTVYLWYSSKSCQTTATSCSFNGLTPGAEYHATVYVYTSAYGSSSAESNRVTVCCVKPGSPYSVSAVAGNAQATVSWIKSSLSGGGVVTFTATSSPDGKTCSTTDSSCVVSGLRNGVAYTFSVVAANAAGSSSPSSMYTSVTPRGPPSDPLGVSAQPKVAGATVSWNPPASDGGDPIVQYVVTADPGGATCVATPAARSCDVLNLPAGTSFTFIVQADNAQGRGAPSAPTSPISTPTVPSPPLAVKAQVSKGAANVEWLPPSSNGGDLVTRYVAVSSPSGLTCESSTLDCKITGLTNGVAYSFVVTAFNGVGPSIGSDPSTEQVLTAKASAPSRVSAKLAGRSATVTWKAPKSTGGKPIKSYEVSASGLKTRCKTKTLTCTFKNLQVGIQYQFVVRAITARGPGSAALSNNLYIPIPPKDAPSLS